MPSNLDKLPTECWVKHPSQKIAVLVKRGEKGFYPTLEPIPCEMVDDLNRQLGVSPAQAEAMLTGSIFGFDNPLADPDRYVGKVPG